MRHLWFPISLRLFLNVPDKYIIKMQKAINSEAMKPTKKPIARSRPSKENHNRSTDYSTSHKKEKFAIPDSIKETHTEPKSQSPFKDHPLYSQQQQLASSFSFSEEDTEFEYEKLLFSKFLQSKQENWISFMHDMSRLSSQKVVSLVKVGQNEQSIHSNRVIAHFIGVWLLSMGYNEPETKRRIVMSVQYLFPQEQEAVAEIAGILYDKLFQGYLPEALQLRILIELCKRGWEYFSFFLGRFIKILRRYKNLREDDFLLEVERAIL